MATWIEQKTKRIKAVQSQRLKSNNHDQVTCDILNTEGKRRLLVATTNSALCTMSGPFQDPGLSDKPYHDPTPMPTAVPRVEELGTTSAPLKSAAFFIGAACKEYNGVSFSSPML